MVPQIRLLRYRRARRGSARSWTMGLVALAVFLTASCRIERDSTAHIDEPVTIPAIQIETPKGVLKPNCQWFGSPPTQLDGTILISVDTADVVGIDALTGRVLWRATEPTDRQLRPLLVHDHSLFVNRLPQAAKTDDHWDFSGCSEVLRIDTANGHWGTSLPEHADPTARLLVSSVIPSKGRLVVSRHLWGMGVPFQDATQKAIDVTVLNNDALLWNKRWACEQPIPDQGAHLLTGLQPTTTVNSCAAMHSMG